MTTATKAEALAGTQSALAQMTADIMGAKSKQAARLTPLAAEVATAAAPLGGKHDTMLPYDDGQFVRQALVIARKEIAFVLRGIDTLCELYGVLPDEESTVDPAARKKMLEQAADERAAAAKANGNGFAADFAAKKAAAQAATFAPTVDDKSPAVDHWVCPEHHIGVEKVSPKGRHYHACTVCVAFEK